ncbi:hypothetical protein TNCV_2926121 [Trichonephila clavipes]|nr:hypothetical protein TNCV_2926121 [Trichonephila clavipes]
MTSPCVALLIAAPLNSVVQLVPENTPTLCAPLDYDVNQSEKSRALGRGSVPMTSPCVALLIASPCVALLDYASITKGFGEGVCNLVAPLLVQLVPENTPTLCVRHWTMTSINRKKIKGFGGGGLYPMTSPCVALLIAAPLNSVVHNCSQRTPPPCVRHWTMTSHELSPL